MVSLLALSGVSLPGSASGGGISRHSGWRPSLMTISRTSPPPHSVPPNERRSWTCSPSRPVPDLVPGGFWTVPTLSMWISDRFEVSCASDSSFVFLLPPGRRRHPRQAHGGDQGEITPDLADPNTVAVAAEEVHREAVECQDSDTIGWDNAARHASGAKPRPRNPTSNATRSPRPAPQRRQLVRRGQCHRQRTRSPSRSLS